MRKFKLSGFLLIGLLALFALALAACQPATPTAGAPETAPTEPAQAESPAAPEATEPPAAEPAALEVPFLEEWQGSAHADAAAEAFTHWNEEDPAEVPAECAKCHSSAGFVDFVGGDGSEAMVVNAAAPIGTVVDCATCHNDATLAMNSTTFPSGVTLPVEGREVICITCHQGTAAGASVDASIEAAGATDEDAVAGELGFTNIHYFAAAVSRYGTVVKGGYEYPTKTYDAVFEHAGGIDECTECHDSHTLEVKVELCAECHEGVASVEDLRAIRYISSLEDYDGDGSIEESVNDEITGMRDVLYSAMQAYASNVAGTALIYTADAYPYFFIDTNADGQVTEGEAVFPNSYKSWTPRLAKAAFNFQTSMKDPGAYAHGGKYIIELLYDSIENLNAGLGDNAVDMAALVRTDPGHFDGSSMAFRDWDADGMVPTGCVRCHTAEGLPMFLTNAATVSVPPSNGLECETCHTSLETYERFVVEQVKFPSGATLGFEGEPDSNLCLNCHQGRESTTSVNARLKDAPADTIIEGQRFINVHYFAAGATLFGTEAKGVYEYEGKTYNGRFTHVENYDSCGECHDAHQLDAKLDDCQGCHQVEEPTAIRMNLTADYDGDGDTEEGLAGEIQTMEEALYAAIQAKSGNTLIYEGHTYPYFFNDANGDGQATEDETISDNSFAGWTPRILRAAYNFQYVQKDPGAYVHNPAYILQVLYDSIQDVGGDVSGMTRP